MTALYSSDEVVVFPVTFDSHFTIENFPSKEELSIECDDDYAALKASYIGKPKQTFSIPASIMTLRKKILCLEPEMLYTPETFPSYNFLEQHEVQYLARGSYNWLKDYYLGGPIPKRCDFGDFGDHYMAQGMTWPQAYIAHALRYESGWSGEVDETKRMAESAKYILTDERFPSYGTLDGMGTKGLTPELYERMKRKYVGTYFGEEGNRDVAESIKRLTELHVDVEGKEGNDGSAGK
mgnify:CR=1 FL=1